MSRASEQAWAARVEIVTRPAVFGPLLACLGLAVSAAFVNRGLPVADEGAVLTLAGRISRGEVFYRDLDAYYFPGAPYLLAGWLRLFGESVNAARWLAAIVFSGTLLGLYSCAARLMDRRRAALFGLSLLSFKFLAWPAFTGFFYSDLSLCFASFAMALMLASEGRGAWGRLLGAGALTALAIASKQSLGIYLALAALLTLAVSPATGGAPASPVRSRPREMGAFALGLALVAAPALGYFASHGLLAELVESGLLRPLLHYLPTSGVSFGEPLAWWKLGELRELSAFPYSVGPLWTMLMNGGLPGGESVYSLYWLVAELFTRTLYASVVAGFAWASWRGRRAISRRGADRGERNLLVFAALAFAVFLSALPRADYFHVISVYPVVLLLLLGLADTAIPERSLGSRRPVTWRAAASVLSLLLVTGALTMVRHRQQSHHVVLARADLHIDPADSWVESVLTHIDRTLGPEDLLFVYGAEASYYFLTGRYYRPWRFTQVYPGQAGGRLGRPLAATLRAHPPELVVRGLMKWPGIPDVGRYASAVGALLTTRYASDDQVFAQHPPAAGKRPPSWAFDMLRLRTARLTGRPAAASDSPRPPRSKSEAAARPNIVLAVADTLRADHFASSSGSGLRTPVFDRLRAESAHFSNAYATASWTTPSTVSIFLSEYPSQHGSTHWLSPLSEAGPSFVEELKRAGYRTGGWSANFLITQEQGFQRGFDEFALVKHREWKFGTPGAHPAAFAPADDLLSKAAAWLDEVTSSSSDAPFFLYVHWMEAHTPYSCPPPAGDACRMLSADLNRRLMSQEWDFDPEEGSFIRGFYAADVRLVDAALGRLVAALEERGLLGDTWLIVTADHGEMLGEHDLYVHGHALHEGTLRVPLLIRPPSPLRSPRIGTLVSLIDLAPTILDVAGVDPPDGFRGRSLLPALDARPLPARPVVAELLPMRNDMGALYRHVLAVMDGSAKYVLSVDGRVERFDLSRDPAEANPRPATLAELRRALAGTGVALRHLEELEAPELELSPEVAEKLKALGYLQR